MVLRDKGFKGVLIALAAAFAMVGVLVATGCGSEGAEAAHFGGNVISEQEVIDYTEEFRKNALCTDDEAWREYLQANGLTAKTWREQTIGALAQQKLIRDKAAELGITPDEGKIQEQLDALKEGLGLDPNDDEAWQEYLASRERTEDYYRAGYEDASILQQIYQAEIPELVKADDEAVSAYIAKNLAGRVIRKYSSISFSKDQEREAQSCLDGLKELSGDELATRFGELVDEVSVDSEHKADGGNIGWEIQMDLGQAENYENLNAAMLGVGELFDELLVTEDAYQILLCTGRMELASDTTADDVDDESLREYIIGATTQYSWSQECAQYLNDLVESADVQVAAMPKGLPYDVDNEA